jgi:hypothetical protein
MTGVMPEQSPAHPPVRRFAPLGFGLHYANMRHLGPRDIALPSIGGAGSSLLGNVLLELGLNYVDPTKEVLLDNGLCIPPDDAVTARVRTQPLSEKGSVAHRSVRWPRFFKTHLPAREYDCDFHSVWLLVRDPRDALYSWHNYHLGFAEAEWEKVEGSFAHFLSQPFFTYRSPIEAWHSFNSEWLGLVRAKAASRILRFEDLKSDPMAVMQDALTACDVRVDSAALRRAVEASSFEAMRTHEDTVAGALPGGPRVMRSGQVSGWKEWMTPELHRHFADERLWSVATAFGYAAEG